MKRKLLKLNSILMILISCLILLLLSIYIAKYFFAPSLSQQENWYDLGKIVLIISIVVAYIINIPAILSGIFSILHANGIKLNILSTIFSVIHIVLELLLIFILFMDPLKLTGWNSGFYTLSIIQILLIAVLVIPAIPSLINIILLCNYKNN